MNGDEIRFNLVTTFHCAECGGPLQITYRPAEKPKSDFESSSNQPTGAAMVHQTVSVKPCRTCKKSADKITTAFGDLMRAAGELKS